MSDEIILVKSNTGTIAKYSGVCHGCNSPIFYEGEIKVILQSETESEIVFIPVDWLRCPHCMGTIADLKIYKNMDVKSELAQIK